MPSSVIFVFFKNHAKLQKHSPHNMHGVVWVHYIIFVAMSLTDLVQYLSTWYWYFTAFQIKAVGIPDSNVHGAKMGPSWVLSSTSEPHVGPINIAIREFSFWREGFSTCYSSLLLWAPSISLPDNSYISFRLGIAWWWIIGFKTERCFNRDFITLSPMIFRLLCQNFRTFSLCLSNFAIT